MRFRIIFYALALISLLGTAYSESFGAQNYTPLQANAIIANATDYVNLINSSSYLVFNPNLTLSYMYLNQAASIYQNSPSVAVVYAYKAESSAQQQYSVIQTYKTGSTYAVAALALICVAILYALMKPINMLKKKKR